MVNNMRDKNMITSKKEELIERKKVLDDYLECIISHNTDIDIKIRLKLGVLIESINYEITYLDLNEIIKKYIDIFLSMGVKLKSCDFNNSLLVEKYMDYFFYNKKYNNDNLDKYTLISQIKECLINLIIKYNNDLEVGLEKRTDDKIQTFVASDLNLYDDYLRDKNKYIIDCISYSCDENIILNDNYISKYYPNYFQLSETERKIVNDYFIESYLIISFLIEFDRYKFVLDDIVNSYRNEFIDKINNDLTILDIFNISLKSFDYLKNVFNNYFIEDTCYNLKFELDRFINFIYSFNNRFICNIKFFSNYNIENIIIEYFSKKGLIFNKKDLENNLFDTYNRLEIICKYILCND